MTLCQINFYHTHNMDFISITILTILITEVTSTLHKIIIMQSLSDITLKSVSITEIISTFQQFSSSAINSSNSSKESWNRQHISLYNATRLKLLSRAITILRSRVIRDEERYAPASRTKIVSTSVSRALPAYIVPVWYKRSTRSRPNESDARVPVGYWYIQSNARENATVQGFNRVRMVGDAPPRYTIPKQFIIVTISNVAQDLPFSYPSVASHRPLFGAQGSPFWSSSSFENCGRSCLYD